MRVYKPNDAREGDVLEWGYGQSVVIVVEVDKEARRIDTVMLLPTEGWMSRAGQRVSVSYSNRDWRRFNKSFNYLSRGWECVLSAESTSTDVDGTLKG